MTCLPAVRDNRQMAIPSEHEMAVYATVAKQAVSSKFYKGIGDESAVMMIMLAARELGIPPMMALNKGINIIQGGIEISARMMTAMIRKAGHQIKIVETTEQICTLKGTRGDTGETETVSYRFTEAQKAGLVKPGGGWTKNPVDMLFARAASRLARQLFSDVIGIGYVEGELKAVDITSSVEIVQDENITREIPVNSLSFLTEYHNYFAGESSVLAYEYLEEVKNHFQWSEEKTLTELLKDKDKLLEKFNKWKSKKEK